MGWEKHVGRVGALAVALGIGSAVAALPGVAWAEPDGTSSASVSATKHAADKPSRAAASDDGADTDASPSGTSDDGAEDPADRRRSGAGKDSEEDTSELDVQPDDADAEEPATPAPTMKTVLRSMFAPRATVSDTGRPDAPGASPLLLTTLTSGRRPLRAAETTAVTTSVPQANAASSPIPGQAYESPVVGADGTLYQVSSGGSTTRVSILDSDGEVVTTTQEIPGTAASYARATMRPDGTLIVVTSTSRRNTIVSAVDSDGTVKRIATLIGVTDSKMTVGANGALYFRTRLIPFTPYNDPIDYRFVRVSENNIARSYSYDTAFELESDGTAHLVSSTFGFSTLRTIDSNGWTRATLLPFGSDPSGPILDQDGTAYVTAGVQSLFGTKSTRVYTVDGTSRTVRSIAGLPGGTVVAADGLYLETYTDDDTASTYISRITASSVDTSDVIDGRINGFQVAPDGTVYAPIDDPALDNTPVAVVDPDGNVVTLVLPGKLVARQRTIRGGGAQSAEDLGYVNYTSNGLEYVAVLGPDATVVRTVELPEGASGGTVFFGPDGAAYELLEYRVPNGPFISRQILALSTDTYTPNVPGLEYGSLDDVVFGPGAVGYLLVGTPAANDIGILGFNGAGETTVPPSNFDTPRFRFDALRDREVLVFAPDGTAYLTNWGPTNAGVYALTSSGAQKVADIEYSQLGIANVPTLSADGTGYVTVTNRDIDGSVVTTVTSFPLVAAR